jgi:hypothetical protein
MTRMTITLSDERHRALKQAAARSGRTIGEIIDASLELYGIKPAAAVEALVDRVRERSVLYGDEALEIAVDETRAARKR